MGDEGESVSRATRVRNLLPASTYEKARSGDRDGPGE